MIESQSDGCQNLAVHVSKPEHTLDTPTISSLTAYTLLKFPGVRKSYFNIFSRPSKKPQPDVHDKISAMIDSQHLVVAKQIANLEAKDRRDSELHELLEKCWT